MFPELIEVEPLKYATHKCLAHSNLMVRSTVFITAIVIIINDNYVD